MTEHSRTQGPFNGCFPSFLPPTLMFLKAGSTALLIQMFKVFICLYFAPFGGLCLTVDCLLELSESRTPDSQRGKEAWRAAVHRVTKSWP